MWAVSYMWYLVVPSGLSGKHLEGGASHSLHGRPSCLGENAGEDEVCRSQVFNSAQEGGCLGQRCRSADQSDQDESVCTCYEITAFISIISGSCFHMLWFSLLTVIIIMYYFSWYFPLTSDCRNIVNASCLSRQPERLTISSSHCVSHLLSVGHWIYVRLSLHNKTKSLTCWPYTGVTFIMITIIINEI